MRKLSNYTRRLICLIPILVGLLDVSTPVLKPVALAQTLVTNPGWTYTGSLNTARYFHTATLLRTGKILVVGAGGFPCSGGFCYATTYNSAELYDPFTGKWSYTGSLSSRCGRHTATLLPNGQVLVAGGVDAGYGSGYLGPLASAELYDPATEEWHPTGSFTTIRGDNRAVLLPSGKVL